MLDPSFRGATDRDERRHAAMRNALLRLTAARGRTLSDPDQCVRALAMLTSFESFDALAGAERDVNPVVATVQELVHAVVDTTLR